MKIGIGNDHHGVILKNHIVTHLQQQGIDIVNYGTNNNENVDYTTYAFQVGEAVRDKKIDYGILICGSGIGMSIACNKVKGVRCAKVDTTDDAKMTRRDNNANVITLSEKTTTEDALNIIDTFLSTPFLEEERYLRRVHAIDQYDN